MTYSSRSGCHRSSRVIADIKSWRAAFVLYSFKGDWTGLAAVGVTPAAQFHDQPVFVFGVAVGVARKKALFTQDFLTVMLGILYTIRI
jgi:hypothetical protein